MFKYNPKTRTQRFVREGGQAGSLKADQHHQGIFHVLQPIHAFKKTYHDGEDTDQGAVIVNLIIPIGAMIHIPYASDYGTSGKFRANRAFVYSQVDVSTKELVERSYSWWEPSFRYCSGMIVEPEEGFNHSDRHCGTGIHFFLDLQKALIY